MTLFISTSRNLAYVIAEDVFVLPGVTLWVDSINAISDGNGTLSATVRVDGTILCDIDSIALFASDPTEADTVIVGATGLVVSTTQRGVAMDGVNARIINDGQISGAIGATLISGLFSQIDNAGTIRGTDIAAIQLIASNSVQITNSGLMRGPTGIDLSNSYAQILNSGTISGTSAAAPAIDAVNSNGAMVIRNSGLIDAPQTAIRTGLSGDRVVNSGTITGDVALGDSNDVFAGRTGTLAGILYGDGGNDLLVSGIGDDEVQGGIGSDTLRGSDGDDSLYGGAGVDFLRGDEGDDRLWGGGGPDDFLFARRAGDDLIEDFTNAQDQIDLSAFHLASFASLTGLAANRPGGLLITLTSQSGGTIFIPGMTLALFDATDVLL